MKIEDLKPFMLGDLEVTSVEVKTINYLTFMQATQGAGTQKEYNRRRVLSSVTFNGKEVTAEQYVLIPLPVAKAIFAVVNDGARNGPAGKVLTPDADGISTPILYKLGTPLKMKDRQVEEIEIQGKTLGDVEDIVASENGMQQAVEILKRISTPVGVKGLTILPEALLIQLTVTDGLQIATEIAPRFTV